ncbi:MAG: hypothetical protein EZS28_044408 [Streblomastix strix]|uniref:Uncharacterized protein n=1 Tax=Streblomastix strix TaxID=222440 RepID=A0A5J4TNQ6_9EUKA|nr:MAG: hypothetical protein EZS28_044408 [Streblomastix strix]
MAEWQWQHLNVEYHTLRTLRTLRTLVYFTSFIHSSSTSHQPQFFDMGHSGQSISSIQYINGRMVMALSQCRVSYTQDTQDTQDTSSFHTNSP